VKVVIRVDSAHAIGNGHVMRTLTLADSLSRLGNKCIFICRDHRGNLIEYIRSCGYITYELNMEPESVLMDSGTPKWLGGTQVQDAESTLKLISHLRPDWIVVDHYAIDASWETLVQRVSKKMMVIDDLADRPHSCDLLLDQTYGRNQEDYRPITNSNCHLLCGSKYALLRSEFARLRSYSLERRKNPLVRKVLISLGGVDEKNKTCEILRALGGQPLKQRLEITVVMGSNALWINQVKEQVREMGGATTVLCGVKNMAQLMAECDLAIGAPGTTAWERCCLGLPTIIMILADNQVEIAHTLEKSGAAIIISPSSNLKPLLLDVLSQLSFNIDQLKQMSLSAANIVDGMGTSRVIQAMEACSV
jgi:UDP-2,4-diacetamido-2,4,6-trideoxy-beta-L-altropyranose hydrolase